MYVKFAVVFEVVLKHLYFEVRQELEFPFQNYALST